MSRIGRAPIELPAGVDFKVEGKHVTVKGPKGTLEMDVVPEIDVAVEGNVVHVTRPSDEKAYRSLHGLTRTLIHNMVVGVTEGYSKKLELVGVGYRAAVKGSDLELALGYSHPVVVKAVEGITFECPSQTEIIVKGIDKQKVGQVTADIRRWRPPPGPRGSPT